MQNTGLACRQFGVFLRADHESVLGKINNRCIAPQFVSYVSLGNVGLIRLGALLEAHIQLGPTIGTFGQPIQQAQQNMFPLLPEDSMAGALEILCYVFTVIGALTSYLLALR